MGTNPAMIRANNELLNIANQTGLNSEGTVHVSTDATPLMSNDTTQRYLVSFVSGVDVALMRVAVLKFFEGRFPVTAKIDSTGGFLVVVQPYRE